MLVNHCKKNMLLSKAMEAYAYMFFFENDICIYVMEYYKLIRVKVALEVLERLIISRRA
jgi:hypothetical protein